MWGGAFSVPENPNARMLAGRERVGRHRIALKPSRLRSLALLSAAALLGMAMPALALAQSAQSAGETNPIGGRPGMVGTMRDASEAAIQGGSITVVITDESGQPLASAPKITITSNSINQMNLFPGRQEGDVWVFSPVPAGDEYVVRVDASGYESEQMFVTLPNKAAATARVDFHLRVAGSGRRLAFDPGHLMLAPSAQREFQQGMKDLRSNHVGSARKHLEKVLTAAPTSPGVNYLVGLTYMLDNHAMQAAPFLQKAVDGDPKDTAALVALGTIHFREGDDKAAIDTLTKALQQDPNSWQANWMLAESYLRLGKYADAQSHAQTALTQSKGKATRVELILGEALAAEGKPEEAATTLEHYAKNNSGDSEAHQARDWAKKLREPSKVGATEKEIIAQVGPLPGQGATTTTVHYTRRIIAMSLSAPAPPPDLPPDTSWMPADVDTAGPPPVIQKSCPLTSVLKKAAKGMQQFITDLQEFSATEEFQAAQVSGGGDIRPPVEKKFDYLLYIHRIRPHLFGLEEMRNRDFAPPNMGVPIDDSGSAALALVFHPDYQSDFEWKCEGLGTWKSDPAWIVHFQQRSDRPTSRLEGFNTMTNVYPMPMKGRAWLLEKTGQILHLEADLMKPIKAVRLAREHFSIDYRQVSFTKHPVKLWLPEDVNTYIEYRGHGYHEYHHFSHFILFWVGAEQKIGKPKIKSAPPKQPPHKH